MAALKNHEDVSHDAPCGSEAQSGRPAPDAIDALFGDAYPQILALARRRLVREHAPISTLTLAHELYIDLCGRSSLEFGNRNQFVAYSARVMRSLLVDLARKRTALKRSADVLPLTIGLDVPDAGGTPEQLLVLDEALTRLGQIDPRLLQVAEMSVIMGMSTGDIAATLGISEPTVKRDWRRAKAWLYEALGKKS
jgi:RNA polymerase sigma factor (TIGR02999 family)